MKKRNVMILIVLLAIGFAAVSTTLVLNGTIGIGSNQNDFDVIFTSATIDGEGASATIDETKKKITFTSSKLTTLNEESVLNYEIKNNSTQYDADVTINCTSDTSEYIKVTNELEGEEITEDYKTTFNAQEIKNGVITSKLIKSSIKESDSISVTCEIVANATERNSIIDYIPDVYAEPILNGSDPVLKDGLVPIVLADDGTVTVADTRDVWYTYEEKKWANAVILNEGVSYTAGEVVPEEDIEAYFVWVPRYKYQIFDEGNYTTAVGGAPTEKSVAKEIQIEFESKDVASSTGSTKDEWLTHPAFTNFDVNGIWVGKFETGYKGATSTETAQVNASDSSKVIVKPNSYSWRDNVVSNMFKTAYNYKRDLDSHMMKNTEWGAVAYLSHSKYGINTEVRINNNSDDLTGYAATDGTNQADYSGTYGTDVTLTLPYNTPTGYKASTTGNITGIYDMSGGACEFMAAYMSGYGTQSSASSSSPSKESGFTTSELEVYKKYFDVYFNDSTTISWNNRILGDATGEMGPFNDKDNNTFYRNNWYTDLSIFIDATNPWFSRGGGYANGSFSGQFNFFWGKGAGGTGYGSRIVLTL